MAEQLVPLPAFARLSERVCVVLGLNPGKFTLQGTNTYLVGTGSKRILIDTGAGVPGYAHHLKSSLRLAGAEGIETVICTHRHWDHVSGISQVLALFPNIPVYKYLTPADTTSQPFHEYVPISDGQRFHTSCGSVTLEALHTPGHTDDHVSLILHEEHAVFTGDAVLGQGSAVFEDLSQYMKSLTLLKSVMAGMSTSKGDGGNMCRIYPGHGPSVEDGLAKVIEYITHRAQREQEVLNCLPGTSRQLVERIYLANQEMTNEQRERMLSLLEAAEGSVVKHLEKLKAEGRVKMQDNSEWSVL
ncbi:hypothetical protein HDU85_006767 [Gaertneriomyces sp. JEL0708]|nr:hypothetical protein HDU85_006767 [Gaertneriomyces sp. JEL0708]